MNHGDPLPGKDDGKETFFVDLPSYSSWYRHLGRDLLHLRRIVSRKSTQSDIDTYGEQWLFIIAHLTEGQVHMRHLGKLVGAEGPVVVYLPPFSIVEFVVGIGSVEFEILMSDSIPPPHMPSQPVAMELPRYEGVPDTIDELFKLFAQPRKLIYIGKQDTRSKLARRVKEMIDKEFREPGFAIAKVAENLGVTHTAMARIFKSCYGITPVVYRNRLRAFHGFWLLMMKDRNVTSTALEVGFTDICRFNQHFRELFKTVPSRFSRHLPTDD